MKNISINLFLVVFWLYILIVPQNIYAYVDPGTGSYFIQLIIGAILGIVFAIKIYWKKIVAFFVKKQKEYKNSEHK